MKQNLISVIRKAGLLKHAENIRFIIIKNKLKKANKKFIKNNPSFTLPPEDLAYDAYSAPDWNYYKDSGEEVSNFLVKIISAYLKSSENKKKILEWGCGPGRIIRHLPSKIGSDYEIYGTDYNDKSIEWCQNNLENIHFKTNQLNPPLPFQAETFDLIYCFSVFTHLSEEVCINWMDELKRVLKPNGIIVFSTHGDSFREKILTNNEKSIYDEKGFLARANVKEGSRAYATVHSPAYVKNVLLKGLKVQEFEKDGFPGSTQDLWIVQKIEG